MASNENIQRPSTERRVFNLQSCEVRSAEGDGPAVFSGYAAVFNELSVNLGGFRERIQPGCFRNAVETGQDVRFLINHDANLILGRTRSGSLKLVEDEVGLRVECELPNTSYANDLAESMRRGDIDQMSFGFVTRADAWKEKDGETGLPIRELVEADLFDVSAVAYPAYPDTTAEVRSLIETEHPELLERAQRAAEEIETPAETPVEETPEERDGDDVVETPEATEATEERVGKTLSQKNADAIMQAAELLAKVLDSANPAEAEANALDLIETVADAATTVDEVVKVIEHDQLPDLATFRTLVEERGWDWDDDWCLWTLTQMLELCSTFVLLADDDESEITPMIASMLEQIGAAVAKLTATAAAEAERTGEGDVEERDEDAGETEEREEADEAEERTEVSRFDKERRRLALLEREIELV